MSIRKPEPALLIVPFVFVVLSFWMMEVRGAYNLGINLDPEYVALLNSLNLATAKSSQYFQHPATTTQILGTFVIWGKWLAGGFLDGPLPVAVVKDHLGYLRAINLAHVLLLFVVAYFAGWSVKRYSGSTAAALAVQCTPLLYQTAVEALPRVAPELFEVIIGLALLIPLSPLLFGAEHPEEARRPWRAFAAGALVACGVATKANFFTLGLLLFLFTDREQKVRFVAAAGAGLLVLLVPLAGAWRSLASWFMNMAVRTGTYGEGDVGLPAASVYLDNLKQVYTNEPFLFWLAAVYALTIAAALAFRSGREYVRPLAVGLVVIVVHTLITAKHFNYHYALPAALVTIPMNGLLLCFLLRVPLQRRARIALIVLATFVGYEAARSNLFRMNWYANWKHEYHQHIAALTTARQQLSNCRVVGYYRSSAPTYALSFGNGLSALIHREALETAYPGHIHFTGGQFRRWDHSDAGAAVREAVAGGACVLLQGTTDNRPAPDGFEFEPVFTPEKPIHGAEALYRLRLPDV